MRGNIVQMRGYMRTRCQQKDHTVGACTMEDHTNSTLIQVWDHPSVANATLTVPPRKGPIEAAT
jgi:hypothetical protein